MFFFLAQKFLIFVSRAWVEHSKSKKIQKKIEDLRCQTNSHNLGLLSDCIDGNSSIRIMDGKSKFFTWQYVKGIYIHKQMVLIENRIDLYKKLRISLMSIAIIIPCILVYVRVAILFLIIK